MYFYRAIYVVKSTVTGVECAKRKKLCDENFNFFYSYDKQFNNNENHCILLPFSELNFQDMRKSYLMVFSISKANKETLHQMLSMMSQTVNLKIVYKQNFYRYYIMTAAMINVMMHFYNF
jgi:hypothetical protein